MGSGYWLFWVMLMLCSSPRASLERIPVLGECVGLILPSRMSWFPYGPGSNGGGRGTQQRSADEMEILEEYLQVGICLLLG